MRSDRLPLHTLGCSDRQRKATDMHLDPNGLEILPPAACRGLVEENEFGRLAFADAASVTILPVTHTVVDDHLVVRTTSGSKMAAASDRRPAALEIDRFDAPRQHRWSVLVRGRLHLVEDDAEIAASMQQSSTAGVRAGGSYVRLSIDEVTGRQDALPSAPRGRSSPGGPVTADLPVSLLEGVTVRVHPGLCEGWGLCHRFGGSIYPLDVEG